MRRLWRKIPRWLRFTLDALLALALLIGLLMTRVFTITLGLQDDTLYEISEDGNDAGAVKTGLGGKLSLSLDLSGGRKAVVTVKKA